MCVWNVAFYQNLEKYIQNLMMHAQYYRFLSGVNFWVAIRSIWQLRRIKQIPENTRFLTTTELISVWLLGGAELSINRNVLTKQWLILCIFWTCMRSFIIYTQQVWGGTVSTYWSILVMHILWVCVNILKAITCTCYIYVIQRT